MTFSGVQSASGTLVASTAQSVTFGSGSVPIRYAYVAITNTGASGTIYARTDGSAATLNGDLCTAINAGATVVMANDAPYWSQAANVIATGTITGAEGTGTPPEVQPYGSSLYGQKASPGTSVSLISSGTPTFTVEGTG
jgi:hypothetical protein